MASIIKRADGRRAVQFDDPSGKRRTIGLGKMSERDANRIKIKIEHLIAARVGGARDREGHRRVALENQ